MRRRFFALAAVLSLLLCGATAWLWARTWHHSGMLLYQREPSDGPNSGLGAVSIHGQILVMGIVSRGPRRGPFHSYWIGGFAHDDPNVFLDLDDGSMAVAEVKEEGRTLGGFGVLDTAGGGTSTRSIVLMFPHWFAVVVFAVAPCCLAIGKLRAIRSNRRKRDGRCVRCGYDLRASRERCPECGAIVGGHC